MKKLLFILVLFSLGSVTAQQEQKFDLSDFYKYDAALEYTVDSIYDALSEHDRIAQMIVTSAGKLGKSNAVVQRLVNSHSIGGVVFLKGSKKDHKNLSAALQQTAREKGTLPLLMSMDAEPSLITGRIRGMQNVGQTIDIKTEKQSDSIVQIINRELKEIGVHHNYAPVVDISPDNVAIKDRSYGSDKEAVVRLSKRFIEASQNDGIIATAKHFPGHGLVKGDTHKQSVYIDGALLEKDNYPPLIEAGVLSVMIGHITVNNNDVYGTDGLPASCSPVIIKDLLQNEMGFKGIVISDALNIMKAVTILDNAPLQASRAGCDIILMPQDEEKVITDIRNEIQNDPVYARQIAQSIKKVLRLKVCAGLL